MKKRHVIAIDLGAQNTGIVLDGDGTQQGALLRLAKSQQQWSQEPRRMARHAQRGYVRRQLAKRLLHVLLLRNGGAIAKKDIEFLGGIVNRRGFTYTPLESAAEIEENRDVFAERHGTILHYALPQVFVEGVSVEDAFVRADEGFVENSKVIFEDNLLLSRKNTKPHPKAKDMQKALQQALDEGADKKEQERLYKAARNIWATMGRKEAGHLPRDIYLQNIAKDIEARAVKEDSFAELLAKAELSPTDFAKAMGHIANLPLRVLRKYFNHQNADGWDGKRLAKLVCAEVRSWQCKEDKEKTERKNYVLALQKHDDVLDCWKSLSPTKTKPPYESQNNRNPPKCMSLLIKTEVLRDNPSLVRAVDAFLQKDSTLANGLYVGKKIVSADSMSAKARILQRVLDCSVAHDTEFRIRELAHQPNDTDLQQAKRALTKLLQGGGYADEVTAFLAFAKKYYAESQAGAKGTWHCHAESILRRCDKNPPHASKLSNVHLTRALGCKQKVNTNEFIKWARSDNAKVGKRGRKMMAIFKDARDLQKKYGNEMKALQHSNAEVKKIYKQSEEAADVIAKYLGHDKDKRKRYANPFTISQLHRHCKGDASGFSSTCRACANDNAWRAASNEGEKAARAKSLPADSVRPFDGMLRRILETQARAIAKLFMDKLQNENYNGKESIEVEIAVEQNAFDFAKNLHDIKKSKKKEPKVGDDTPLKEAAVDKQERIRSANKHCPYTGEKIGMRNIDHIVPRAACRGSGGAAAFNSEANLIGCSVKGNVQKGAEVYTLSNLRPQYLQEVFGKTDIGDIEKEIRESVTPFLQKRRRYTSFVELLKEDERAALCLRHGLFVDDLREIIINRVLANERAARVNGTQRFLAKKIWAFLGQMFSAKGWASPQRAALSRVDAFDVYASRMFLSEEWHKPNNMGQGVMSHIADAAIVRILASKELDFSEKVFLENMPKQVRVIHLEKRAPWRGGSRGKGKGTAARYKIFADTIYGERFLPLLVTANGSFCVGFSPTNAVTINKEKVGEWLSVLSPFLSPTFAKKELVDLQKLARADSQGYICMAIHKQRAMQFMLECWQLGKDTEKALPYLQALHYVTMRKAVQDKVWHQTEKKMRTREDILGDSDFMIMAKLAKLGGEEKPICLPSKKHWQEIVDAPVLAKLLGQKLPENVVVEEVIKQATEKVCKIKKENRRKHYRRRNVRSLQILSKPPSKAWRIRRRTPNGHVFQLLNVNKYSYSGFAQNDDGTADFNKTASLAETLHSQFIAPLTPTHKIKSVVDYDDWLAVAVDDDSPVIEMQLSPATESRMQMQVTLQADDFLRIVEIIKGEQVDYRHIPAEINIGADDKEEILAVGNILFPSVEVKEQPKIVRKMQVIALGSKTAEIRFFVGRNKFGQERYNAARKKRKSK